MKIELYQAKSCLSLKFVSTVESPNFPRILPDGMITPNVLKNGPKDFYKHVPAIEYLNLEGFSLHHRMTDEELASESAMVQWVSAMQTGRLPVDLINTAVGQGVM